MAFLVITNIYIVIRVIYVTVSNVEIFVQITIVLQEFVELK